MNLPITEQQITETIKSFENSFEVTVKSLLRAETDVPIMKKVTEELPKEVALAYILVTLYEALQKVAIDGYTHQLIQALCWTVVKQSNPKLFPGVEPETPLTSLSE